MQITVELQNPSFVAGVVVAEGVKVAPSSDELIAALKDLVARRATEEFPPAEHKEAVRNLLKAGGFKPSGRNKPASEYLAQAARENRFPFINNLVDINNLLSLETGLPISILDLRAVGPSAVLRCGRPGEKYVFNNAGQEIDLAGLICLCGVREGGTSVPFGNSVKDSMEGKLKSDTTDVIAVIYGTTEVATHGQMQRNVEKFADFLKRHAGAKTTSVQVLL